VVIFLTFQIYITNRVPHKGKRIDIGLMKEAGDIGAGIVLNERTAGLTLPDLKGKGILIAVLEVIKIALQVVL